MNPHRVQILISYVLFVSTICSSCGNDKKLIKLSDREFVEGGNYGAIILKSAPNDTLYVGTKLFRAYHLKLVDGEYLYYKRHHLISRETYISCRRNGPSVHFDSLGVVRRQGYFVNGEKRGYEVLFNEDGTIAEMRFYQ